MSFWLELATGFSVTHTAWLRALTAPLNAAAYSSASLTCIECSCSFSFLRTVPARNPRTECGCHPVVLTRRSRVAPCGCRSRAITLSCLDTAPALRGELPIDFAFEVFFAVLARDRPRTFFSGFDWAARTILTEEAPSGPGPSFAFSGMGTAADFGPAFSLFEVDGTAWVSRWDAVR